MVWEPRLGQTVAYGMSGWGAWMLYTVRISCKRWDIKSSSSGEWHKKYRVSSSSVRQKIEYPKQATWQRQSENKEKFTKTTQRNAIQLLECRGSRVHFHKVARAREGHQRGHVRTEQNLGEMITPLQIARSASPLHLPRALRAAFPPTSRTFTITLLTAVFPKGF